MLPGSIGGCSPPEESLLGEGLGVKAGTQGAAEPSSRAMGWNDGPLQAGALWQPSPLFLFSGPY